MLAAPPQIAQNQGRPLYEVLHKAVCDYITRHASQHLRDPVLAAFAASQMDFDTLYPQLAE